jgi:hypothetical protein
MSLPALRLNMIRRTCRKVQNIADPPVMIQLARMAIRKEPV